MSARRGCGLVAFGVLFVAVACLVFAALPAAMVRTGEIPLSAPRLTGLQPDPSYSFRPTTPITLTFDQPMDTVSVEAAFSVEPYVAGSFQWNKGRTEMVFVPDELGYRPGTDYRARLAPGVRAGTIPRKTKRGIEWGFSLPPLLDTLAPAFGEENLGAGTRLEAAFNYRLDCAFTLPMFSITPSAVGVLECRDGFLAFNPTEPLAPGTAYHASVGHVLLEGDPSPRPGVQWQFTTAPPLVIVDFSPGPGPPLTDLWTPISITFNRPVVADSVVERFSVLPRGGAPVLGEVVWEDDGARFVFRPEEALSPATRYQMVLLSGVRDVLGFKTDETVAQEVDTAPMIGLPLPVPGSRDVALDSTIRIPFTRPMDKASVEAGLSFRPNLEGEMAWDEDTLVFTPRGGLAAKMVYKVTLQADVGDATGARLGSARQWAFSTQAFMLDAKVPQDTGLTELQRPIDFTFALPMDRASVQSALVISPTTPGEWDWADDNRSVSFQPDPAWLSGASYSVMLAGSARTADRYQTLGEELSWNFSTEVVEVQFGDGPNVQLMDAEGRRAFQVVTRGADVADFQLHAITPTQFLDLYSSGIQGVGPDEPQIIDTMGLTPTVEWREPLRALDTPYRDQDWQPAEARLPADVPPGMYVLTYPLPEGGIGGGLIVVLTHHALVLKRALAGSGDEKRAQVVVWDTELSGAAPAISSTVRLYDGNGAFLAEGQTDADGLLELDVAGDPGPLIALSDRAGDISVCGLGNEWSDTDWWWTPSPSRPLHSIFSYTDRPIYRPGQTVHFKNWIRADDDVSYTLPSPDLPVTLRLRDARDNIAATQVLTSTQFGTVHGEFQLTDEPMLGTWSLETELQGTVTRQPLAVEEYRKPDYEVSVRVPQKAYVHGEVISVTVDAGYYFGQPVADANVVLRVYLTYPGDFFGEDESRFGYPLIAEEGRTDAQGRWMAIVSTGDVFAEESKLGRAVLALEATVTDDIAQSVSSYQTVVVYRTSAGMSLLMERHGYRPNEDIGFSVRVRDPHGEPVRGAEITAQVLGGDDEEVAKATAATDDAGLVHFSVNLAEQGWYQLQVHNVDQGGRQTQAQDYLWVYDPSGRAPWYREQRDGETMLSASPDRTVYEVGDEAQILVSGAVPGQALLTFERGETRHAQPITLVSGTNLITVPVRGDFAPNIQVTVNQFGPLDLDWWEVQSRPEMQLHKASAQLLVPMSDRLLTVTLTAEQEAYAPGDLATFYVQVTDHDDQPVVAEVSLAVVDEAIYALAEDLSQDPFEFFYAPRPSVVRTFDSLNPTRWLLPESPGLGGGGEEEGSEPRRDFFDTAYWAPTLITDEAGEATVTFELPDNLTEWRVLARAITTDTLVGEATTSIVVSQDIVIRPSIPRFLVLGDVITLTTEIHNYSERAVSATVQLDLDGLALAEERGREEPGAEIVHIPAGGSIVVGWPVLAEESSGFTEEGTREAQVAVRVTATYSGARLAGRDAVELSLPVLPLAVPEVTTWAGELTPAQPSDTITVTAPSDTIDNLSWVEISLAPSVTRTLLDGLEYLIGYPYGCVEQTMSRVLPNAMVAQAFRKLSIHSELLEAELPPMVDLGLQKLYAFQHNDGGWGWWYDDSTDVNQTAYVLLGLTITEQAGFDVDDGVMDKGSEALRGMLPSADPRAQAYGGLVLALAGQPVTLTLTLSEGLDLDLFSQAALAVAFDAAGEEANAAALLDSLREAANQDETAAYWRDDEDQAAYSRSVMGSTVRTTAMVASALTRVDPQDPLLPKAVRWLMEQREGQGWGDTQKTSFAVLALADYLLASQDLSAGTGFQVHINGRLWQEGMLHGAQAGLVLTLPVSSLQTGDNRVELRLGATGQEPAGRLYYAVILSASNAPQEGVISALQADARSIGVRRGYSLVGGDSLQISQEPSTQFRRGDLVEVRLSLDVPEESWYVVVDDPLPAGFEALNERLGTTSHVATAYEEPALHWEQYGYNRKEVHDERVTFFITHLQPGEQDLTYVMRATTTGLFTALPTQVYLMYEPEVWSRFESTRCQVVAR